MGEITSAQRAPSPLPSFSPGVIYFGVSAVEGVSPVPTRSLWWLSVAGKLNPKLPPRNPIKFFSRSFPLKIQFFPGVAYVFDGAGVGISRPGGISKKIVCWPPHKSPRPSNTPHRGVMLPSFKTVEMRHRKKLHSEKITKKMP